MRTCLEACPLPNRGLVGSSENDRLLGSFSGAVIPGPFTSSGHSILVVFTSADLAEGKGFSAEWSTFQLANDILPCTSDRQAELLGPSGDFGCDGYSPSQSTSFLISGNVRERIAISFLTFDIDRSNDLIQIYDG